MCVELLILNQAKGLTNQNSLPCRGVNRPDRILARLLFVTFMLMPQDPPTRSCHIPILAARVVRPRPVWFVHRIRLASILPRAATSAVHFPTAEKQENPIPRTQVLGAGKVAMHPQW